MKRSGPTGVVSQQSDDGNCDGVLLLARDKGRGERIWEDSVRKGEDMYRGARGLWLKIMLGIGCDGGRGSAMATTKESSLNHTKKTTFVIYCCLLHKKIALQCQHSRTSNILYILPTYHIHIKTCEKESCPWTLWKITILWLLSQEG